MGKYDELELVVDKRNRRNIQYLNKDKLIDLQICFVKQTPRYSSSLITVSMVTSDLQNKFISKVYLTT